MSKLTSYYLPGLYVEDHSIEIPLDWRGTEPARAAKDGLPAGERISLFYRVVCAAENVGRPLPLLVYLQGGPGGKGPRLTSPSSDGWVAEAYQTLPPGAARPARHGPQHSRKSPVAHGTW